MNTSQKIALVAIGRQENLYAREWVEHHLNVGFTHIFVADNNYDGEEHFEEVLADYITAGKVTVIDYRDCVAVQKQAYNDIYASYGSEYDWMAFFDFDEFLDLRGQTLEGLLSTAANMVLVNWECYGDNGLLNYDDRPCWERFTKPLPHPLYVQYTNRAENEHVKSILRGGLGRINFYHNPHVIDNISPFQPYDHKKPVLRHYITKTAEEWLWRSRRGSGSRTLAMWRKTYAGRFFKYNERTNPKEIIMEQTKRTVAIVNFNTTELTEAAILSLRKHGGMDYKVVVFDNSNERPFATRLKGVTVVDNTKGQIIDFDKELAKFPNKVPECGVDGKCAYGSDKHMMSIQKLFDICPEGFLLMDSDILLTQSVDSMFREDQCCVGHIQTREHTKNPYGIERLMPILCYINVPLCKSCGISYWDPKRSWQLHGKTRYSWYDTGASFLEDIRSHKRGAHGKRIDIRRMMVHLKSGSWLNEGKAKAWLQQYKHLWEMPAEEVYEPEEDKKPAPPSTGKSVKSSTGGRKRAGKPKTEK